MFDRQYFDKVLPDQLRIMSQQARLVVRLHSGRECEVWSLVAAHDAYVILEGHAGGQEPSRSKRWQEEHPDSPPWVFDQVAVPYANINETFLMPKTLPAQAGRPIGFRPLLPNERMKLAARGGPEGRIPFVIDNPNDTQYKGRHAR